MIAPQTAQPFATFLVGDLLFGVPATSVREVIRGARITHVPLVSPALCGVFNVRGEVVAALDLRLRLGLPDAGTEALVHVLFSTPHGTMSLLVDREGDVVDVASARFEQPPGGLGAAARDCVVGAYKLPRCLLIVLDTERAFELGAEPGGPDSNR